MAQVSLQIAILHSFMVKKNMTLNYVLITPAHNEALYINDTIQAVINQTLLPKRWVIVSDGSTDGTDDIIKNYVGYYDWIKHIRIPEHNERDFASKVYAFNKGYSNLKNTNYDIIGCLDADITFCNDYFEYLVYQFKIDPSLGVAGTHYIEGDFHSYKDSHINIHHVNGGCQLFRKSCFDDIGGYKPIKAGGVDWVAVTTARMKGWKTFSFSDRIFYHHRKIGTAGSNVYKSRFNYGRKDYFLGSHPGWMIMRGGYQMTKKPYIIGGLLIIFGFLWAWFARTNRQVTNELMSFHRKEQIDRLYSLIRSYFKT